MADRMSIQGDEVVIETDEGRRLRATVAQLEQMLADEIRPPVDGTALADGVKFVEWRPPILVVVHQRSPQVRLARWIAPDSPAPYGPGTRYRQLRLSMPYAITFAVYARRGGQLFLTGGNELYFRNAPLEHKTDQLGYPALLNVSRIETRGRLKSWICTQHLRLGKRRDWKTQLEALLEHTWNGGFNLSSEHHEGASWYGAQQGVHPDLHPVERWERATHENDAFALGVPWQQAAHNAGELIECLIQENGARARLRPSAGRPGAANGLDLASRFLQYLQQHAK